MNRKHLFAAAFLCLFGIVSARAQTPVADFSATPTSGCGPLRVQFTDLSTGALFWQWDFGNGVLSNQQNPSITYTAPGTYTVTLQVRNKSGTNAIRKTDYITVFPYPTPAFTSGLELACAPVNIQFTDQSTPGQGSISSWAWNLGDGSTSTQPNPSHVYSQTGYYNVSLRVTNSGGCANTISKTRFLRVVDGIQPNFDWNQTSASCSAPYQINFINQTAGPGDLIYNWNLGNGAASTDTSPVNVIYPANNDYTVTLRVQSSLGCSDTIQRVLAFGSNGAVINGPDTACLNTAVTFSDGSTPPPSSANWDFGDGTTSTDLNPVKTYTTAGRYTVTLANTFTSCSSSVSKTVVVVNPLVAAFTGDQTASCKAPLTVNFTDRSLPAAEQWLWDFGDGQTSTDKNPSHTYNTDGNFDVKLTVTGPGGCVTTKTMPQYIRIRPPTVSLSGNSVLGACVAGTPTFTTIRPVAAVNAVDGVSSFTWSAPGANPATATGASPSFQYASPGNYSITLTVQTNGTNGNGGCNVVQPFTNAVQIGTPTAANISSSENPICGPKAVTFSSISSPVNKWLWDFGDNSTSTAPSPVTHMYERPTGDKTVTLTVTHDGCPQQTTLTQQVKPPFARFGYTVNCLVSNLSVDFHDSSDLGTPAVAATYTWDFGDGTPVFVTTTPFNTPPTHVYATYGSYPASLTVTTADCSDTYSLPVQLGTITPEFSITPDPVCKNQPFTLTSTSVPIGPLIIASYDWTVGTNPPQRGSATFNSRITDMGNYTLALQIQDANGCFYNSVQGPNIQVTGPSAGFIPNTAGGACRNSPITFNDQSTPYSGPPAANPITSWSWDFGDGSDITAGQNATHSFTDTGAYRVKLTVTDNAGCADTYTLPTEIRITAPAANFAGPDSFYCPGVPLTFIDSSQGYGPFTYLWSYGDGSPDDATGIHPFPGSGQTGRDYNVTLTVTDRYHCQSAPTTKSIRIQSPIAAFDIADTTAICTPLQTMFTARGQFYDSLYWDFGDETTSTLPVTSHFYNDLGILNAKLFLRGPGGCLDSATRRVLLLDPNTTQFSFTPTRQCNEVPAQFSITPPDYTLFTVNFGDGAFDSSQNHSPLHTYQNPNTYTPLLVLQDATGCIVNRSNGGVVVLGSSPFFTLNPHAFCDTSTVTFTDFTISNDGILSQTLDFGDGSIPVTSTTGVAGFTAEHFYDRPGKFLARLHVITNNNCAEDYIDTVSVYQTPHPVISVVSQLCTGLIQFNGGLTAPEVDTIQWAWEFGNGQSSAEQNPSADFKPGSYTVKLHTAVSFGCNDTTSRLLTINPLPEIRGPREITTPLGIPVTIPFTYSENVNAWVWTPADHLDCPTCANPSASLLLGQTYHVTATDVNACSVTDSIHIKTICNDQNYFLPNTFSPNNDGVNDYFYPRGSSLYNIQSLRVFNRWGQLVFERRNFPANAATMGWDGTFNGKPAQSDAYVYIAEVICDNAQVIALRGDVTLVR